MRTAFHCLFLITFCHVIGICGAIANEKIPARKFSSNEMNRLESIQKTQTTILTLKPNLCVLKNEHQTCDDSVLVEWQSQHIISPCLTRDDQTAFSYCWKSSKRGEIDLPITTRKTIVFSLQDRSEVIAQKSLEVLIHFPARKERLRKRNPWSIF